MDIVGYENYLIYDDGRVYSKRKGKFMKPSLSWGYFRINLKSENKIKYNTLSVHRLVALHYIANPENKKEVDHKDRDRINNNVNNLRWATRLENSQNLGNYKTNTSGVKNICYDKFQNRWKYRKMINGKNNLKYFNTLEDAVEYKSKFEI
tara:strand:+ start:93 stop:542 length:450 start_codon:yes stop_codon:yes gene_type:complete